MGPERRSAVIQEKNRQLVAYHEGGHAIVALFTSESLPVYKATIMPRGQALGMVCVGGGGGGCRRVHADVTKGCTY